MNYKKINHYLLLIVTVLIVISGYGITKYRTVESLTFGLLDKPTSFKLHSFLAIIFIVLLAIHIFPLIRRKK